MTPTLAALAAAASSDSGTIEVPANLIREGCERIMPEMLPLVQLSQEEIDRIVAAVPGGMLNVQDIYPLAPLQEGILFHHLMNSVGDPYLLAAEFSFDSRARLDKYLAAMQAVIDWHDILRTAIRWEGLPEPVQVVMRKAVLPIEEVSLDVVDGDMAEQLYARFDPRHYRMDVGQAPLMRVYIAEDRKNDRWLLLQLRHHLTIDHTAQEVMDQEIEAHLLGEQHRLPAPFPFRNLVAQARLGVSGQEHERFFREMLGDVDEPTAPFGLVDVQGDGSGIEEAYLALGEDLARRLRAQARRLGASVASLCHLAWARVLAQTCGREDVVFGTVLFGRMQGGEGADRVMGLFINTLPVRIRAGEEGVEASVRRVHGLLADLLRHEHASLAMVQRCSGVPAPAPLFSSLLNYRHSPGADQQPSEQSLQAWEGIEWLRGEERTNYSFTLSVEDYGQKLGLTAQVPGWIGSLRICEFMRTALESLSEALETSPATGVRALPVLPRQERNQVLYEWNDTGAEFPSDKCIHELIEEQAARTPDAVAVLFEESSLSYGELNAKANRLAQHLRELGVGPDVRVALCVERSLEMIVGLVAVLKAGGAYVPLDPDYPVERLRFMLEDSAPVVLLTQSRLQHLFPDLRRDLPVLLLEQDADRWQSLPPANLPPARIGLNPHHLAYLIYTSGSTGTPKGVMVKHGGLVNRLVWMQHVYGLSLDDAVLQKTPFSFDVSVWELFWPLLTGARLVVAHPEGHKDPAYLAAEIRRHAITTLHFVPSMLQIFLDHLHQEMDLNALSRVICSGEALSASLAHRFQDRLPDVRLHNLYGPTEATVDVTAWSCTPDSKRSSIPIGRPIANTQIYILDAHGEPVPIGVTGELYIGGAGVARGYLNRPELTEERFLSDPFSSEPGARMYRTGDLGRWLADGNIEFLGRNDFQVKIRGFRIELGEIEARLAEHPGVREAVVAVREAEPGGDKRLVAYYRTDDEALPDVEQLGTHLSATLPEYMVPAAYVRVESFPLTPSGKLDRRALPVPEGDAYATRGYEPPVGETETILAGIWADLLKLDRVGRHDNFFELGGHSLLAVRTASRIQQVLGFEATLSALFRFPVLGELARSLQNARQAELPAITRVERGEQLPLSFAQQRLWFLAQMEGVSQAYHIFFGLRLRGVLDTTALRWALDRLVARHEALRTTFAMVDGEPVQRIAAIEDSRFELIEHDLRQHADRQVEGDALTEEEFEAPFALDAGPLIRGRLLHQDDDQHVLLITMHHIVSDGWSKGLLIRELSALYNAFHHGRRDPLPELEIQYADYAVWQRQWVEGEILQRQAEYWKKALADAPVLLSLPTDHLRPAQQDHEGAFAELVLDEQLTAGLKKLSSRHDTTLFMTLLGAWSALMARLAGQQDVVVGTPTANRGRMEIEGLIGFFVNTLALRVDVSSSPTVKELLEQVRAQSLAAQQNQDIPFEQVVELINPVRSLTHSPLFQVMFVWQNNEQGRFELPELEVQWLGPTSRRTAKFDLSLSLVESGDGIVGGLEYAVSLFDAATIERWLGYFRNLLQAMVADENQVVERLSILSAAERDRVLYEWNDTKAEFPSDKCVHELIEEQAARTPDAVAVVFEESSLSYGELNRRANQLAHYLREVGVKADERVALCLEPRLEMIVGLLAVLKAGGAYVPLEPNYPAQRLRFMLKDSSPLVLLTQKHLAGLFAGIDDRLSVLDLNSGDAPWKELPISNPEPDTIGLNPHHLAYVIYTSGSTGMPKGVMAEHCGIRNLVLCYIRGFKLTARDIAFIVTSASFDLTYKNIYAPLIVGGQICLMRDIYDPQIILSLVSRSSRDRIFMNITPTGFYSLIDASMNNELSRLGRVIFGGESIQTGKLLGIETQTEFINSYGPTECTGITAYHRIPSEIETSAGHPVPIGRPIWNTRLYILDGHGEPVPVGVTGEMYIGGAGVARGYVSRPELTEERFLADPFSSEPGARMYRTGDLGRWLGDGNIEFVGRSDFQVKIRGFRIELGEIEARLAEHPGVREAVVVAREDTRGEKRLVAYYRAEEDGVSGAEQLRTHLSETLPEYMVPAAYVRVESFPRTPSGKLDRRALPVPESDAYATAGYEAPQGETEMKLAAIWADLLGLERVGRQDNFFSLGGHSLLAVRMVTRLRQRFGLEVTIRDLFMHPVLRDLADALAGAVHAELPPIAPRSRFTPSLITATGSNGHKIASRDQGKTWFDFETGKALK
jgi:amino acid adenylation domain-containing protein